MLLMILLFVLLLGILTIATVTYWRFWLAAAGTEHMALIRERSENRILAWGLRAYLSSMSSQAISLVLYPAFLFKKYWLAPKSNNAHQSLGPPVLFVHGYTHTASAWVAFAHWFRKAGYRDLHALTYQSVKNDFWNIVGQLEREVEALDATRPNRRIILVGHSLGGLAIRAFLNTSPLRHRIAAVVTLGTPHQGSELAGLGMNALGKALAFNGDLIQNIQHTDAPPPAPCLSIFSPMDNMVLPLEGLRIHSKGWREMEGDPVCHIGMLYHKTTAQAALDFLRTVPEAQAEA